MRSSSLARWVGRDLLLVGLLGLVAPAASAQEPIAATRADVLRLEREENARSLSPHEPNLIESSMAVAENRLMPLLLRDGVHWKLGSLTTGSGFAYGGGYRHRRLLDRNAAFTVWAAASLKRYWAVEARFDLPDLADGRVVAGAYARRHHYPNEEFFGVGPDSRRRDQSAFSLGHSAVGAQAGLRPWRTLTVGAGTSTRDLARGQGRPTRRPQSQGASTTRRLRA